MKFTKLDLESIRDTAQQLREGYDQGEEDSTTETVMLSSGYAEVSIDGDDTDTIEVTQHGNTVKVDVEPAPETFNDGDILHVVPVGNGIASGHGADWITETCTVIATEDGTAGGWDVYDVTTLSGEPRSIYGFQIASVEESEE